MGKNLIIKGADFQNNALIVDIDITQLCDNVFVKGINGVSMGDASARAGIRPRVDISGYKAQGYNKIEINVKIANCVTTYLCGTADQSASGSNNSYALTVNSAIGTYVFDIENTYGYYLGCNINIAVADLNSFSDYCQVILKP